MSHTRVKRTHSWQYHVLRALCIILAIVFVLMLSATIYVESLFSKLNRELSDSGTDFTHTVPDDVDVIESEGTLNIMLVGTDLSEARSDTMILCTVNKGTKTITLTSFMRDTYVDIPDYFPHKMNTAYALDGFSALNSTLAENFGVLVDGNVAIDFESFIQAIDIIGGVDIELTEDEAWYMMNTPWNGLSTEGWSLSAGVQTLNGDQALAYSRIRDISDSEGNSGDFGRTSRQRRVLSQLVEQCKTMNILQLNSLLNKLLPMVSTNLSNAQITSYALECLPVLLDCTIKTQQIPAEDTYHLDWVDQDGGMSVIWVDDFDANCEILEDIISPQSSDAE